jgi:hypothetical protein
MSEPSKPADPRPEFDSLAPLLQWLESAPRAEVVLHLDEDEDGTQLVTVTGSREQLDPEFEVPQGVMAQFRISMLLEDARKCGIGPIVKVLGDMASCEVRGPGLA